MEICLPSLDSSDGSELSTSPQQPLHQQPRASNTSSDIFFLENNTVLIDGGEPLMISSQQMVQQQDSQGGNSIEINMSLVPHSLLEEIQRLENSVWDWQSNQIFSKQNGTPRDIYKKHCLKMKIGKTSKSCSICCLRFETGDIVNQLPCKHMFHISCIRPWLKQSTKCPNCRLDLINFHQQAQSNSKQPTTQNSN